MFQMTAKVWKMKTAYVFVTEMRENERLVQKFATGCHMMCPEDFAGEKLYVYHRLNYVQPCDDFLELKKLQSAIKGVTGLRANFRGIVALDVQEWLGHLNEEYFIIALKFLHDHMHHGWRYVFTVGDGGAGETRRLMVLLARYFNPCIVEATPFRDAECLEVHIAEYIGLAEKRFDADTRRKFAELLVSSRNENIRDLEVVRNIVFDVAGSTNAKVIGNRELRNYLAQPLCLMNLLCPRNIEKTRRGGKCNA